MDPFKKSLGINFGPLFSVQTQDPKNNENEKKGAQLFGDPPSDGPQRDHHGRKIEKQVDFLPIKPVPQDDWFQDSLHGIILVDGRRYRLINGIWYVWEKPNPLNSGVWARSDIRSSKGLPYFTPEGRAMTDKQVAERNYELGIGFGFGGGGGSPSNQSNRSPLHPPKYIDPAEKEGAYSEQFEPGYWHNEYAATEVEKTFVRKAVEEIFNNKCLDNIPGLRDCLKKQWKETILGFNDLKCIQGEHSYKLGLGGHTRPKWYTGKSISEMYLCRKNMTNKGKIDYTQLKAVLLHEMLHLCVGLRNLQEFDAYVIANMCDPNAFGKTNADYWPKTCESQNPPWGYETTERDFAPFRDPATGRYFWASDKFLWDPVTGEVFLKERNPLNILQPYKLGKKMPIIWKCPG